MKNILIIEDNDEVAAVFEAILTDAGYSVERSAAAYGAVLRALKTPFDLVLMDLLLQGANGAVAALALRGLGFTGPIIIVTGGAMPIDQAAYDRAGFTGRLLKPVLPSELLAEVARQLDQEIPS